MGMSVFFNIAFFYVLLLALALWGAWVGWTRSKSPTARVFVVTMALVWAGFTVVEGVQSYRLFEDTGVMGINRSSVAPVEGGYESCSLCYEGPAGRVYVVAASRIEGARYHLTGPRLVRYSVRFESGTVSVDGQALEPGCHGGQAPPGTNFVVRRATGFRLEVGDAAGCD